jgi:hypothetical protein
MTVLAFSSGVLSQMPNTSSGDAAIPATRAVNCASRHGFVTIAGVAPVLREHEIELERRGHDQLLMELETCTIFEEVQPDGQKLSHDGPVARIEQR